MKLLIGLGNPGKEYNNTRHNIGFIIINYLYDNWLKAENFSNWATNKKLQSTVSEGIINGNKLILGKPETYMNESGLAVRAIIDYYKIQPRNLIVIHDDVDLKLGDYKIQSGKSSAGHNGVESIIQQTGTKEFTRIRIGVGREPKAKQGDTAEFVLGRFSLLEKIKLKSIKERALEEIKKIF